MALTVPRLPSESLEGLPSARVDGQAPLAAFGGGQGNVGARIAQGASEFSGQIEQIAREEKRKADIIATTNAGAQLSDLETNLRVHARSQLGSNAFGLPEDVGSAWKEGSSKIAEGMTNPTQKLAFEEQAKSHWSSLNEAVQMHVADQRKVYAGQVYDGYLASEANAATASYTDPARVALSIDRRKAAITDHAAQFGIAPEERDKVIAQMQSDTHVTVLNEMLANTQDAQQPILAKQYYDAHKNEIIGPKAAITDSLIQKKSLEGAAQEQGDAIYKQATSLDDALNKIEAQAKANPSVMTPQVREKTEERVRRRFEDKARSDHELNTQTVVALNDQLHANGGNFDALPINLRDRLTPNEEESMRRNADQIRNPKQRTNLDTKAKLLNLAGLHPDDFKSLDLTQYKDQFSPQDYSTMLNKQLSMRTSDTKAAQSDAKRTERQDEATAKKNAAIVHRRAALLESIKDPTMRANIQKHLPPIDTLPHGVTPSTHTAPGGPMEPLPPAGGTLNMTPVKPVSKKIADLNVPASWKDASADDPAYAAYLEHHSLVGGDAT